VFGRNCDDAEGSILSFLRKAKSTRDLFLIVYNFTPVCRHDYRMGAPRGGSWKEVLNSDAKEYGGSSQGNFGGIEAAPVPLQGRSHSLTLTLLPLGVVFLKSEG